MKRRSDRGEGDGDGCFTVILLIAILFSLWGIGAQLTVAMGEIRRIADAVAVYAPPAEEAPDAE